MVNKKTALILFAKVLDKNIAKTRIAKTVGEKKASKIYEELLGITATVVKSLTHYISFAGAKTPNRLNDIFLNATDFFIQCDGDLGERMRYAFNQMFDLGYDSVIAIGTDCPTLKQSDLKKADEFLQKDRSVVIGPAVDGGYYLIGCQKETLAVLNTQKWSTPELFDEAVEIIRAKKFNFLALDKKDDIDEYEDYINYKNLP